MMPDTVLITGGMGGVGKAAARALSHAGYRIALTYHSSPPEEVATFMRSLEGEGHLSLPCDVRDPASVAAAVAAVSALPGEIGVCVHTAVDSIARDTVAAMQPDTFRNQFETGVFGAFNLFSSLLPYMKEGGLIVGITTSFLEPGAETKRIPGYIAAKFALRGLLRELATEASARNIRVNAIAPDLLNTKLSSDLPPRYFEFAAERDPRGRITTPEEVAEKILFLLSPQGNTITGMSLSVLPDKIVPL